MCTQRADTHNLLQLVGGVRAESGCEDNLILADYMLSEVHCMYSYVLLYLLTELVGGDPCKCLALNLRLEVDPFD